MKKIIVSIVAVAVMALAVGCGNSGSTQSTGVAKSSTAKSNVTSNIATVKTMDEKAFKTTYTDFKSGDFTFTNLSIHNDRTTHLCEFKCTITYNGTSEIMAKRLGFKFHEPDEVYTLPHIEENQTLVPGKSVDFAISRAGDAWRTEKIEFLGEV